MFTPEPVLMYYSSESTATRIAQRFRKSTTTRTIALSRNFCFLSVKKHRSFTRHNASCRNSPTLLFDSALLVLTLRLGTMGTPVKNSQISSRFSSKTRPLGILEALWPLCERNTLALVARSFAKRSGAGSRGRR